ncbi:hypothetical protein BDN72DRAFT_756469 [Pluteus cervinus]|uniref:Uncharacterized protein n=1 Tax=Pluteus cervinus TaxID=181527 RepID=A0ACD3BC16_9AGAR|nr:hypothetical protein BDN72DRAFT_756469 [Pluteus cervinus]
MATPHRRKRRKVDGDTLPTPKKTRGPASPRKRKTKPDPSPDTITPDTSSAIVDPLPGPSKLDGQRAPSEQTFISIDELPPLLPDRFHGCLRAQKLQILRASQRPSVGTPAASDEDPSTNEIASTQLKNLLDGTLSRGEGNSCLIMGPRGSGKSRIVEQQLDALAEKPIILRLSGWVQRTDRLALREIAYQLTQQTGSSFLLDDEEEPSAVNDDDENPFLVPSEPNASQGVALPPASHLPALIGMLPTLSRPSIVILDAFDLFALHPRQSLLYCLLDTAQSCRAGAGSKGIVVIGMTSRIDANNMLEKRVKSRFSGRIYRTAPPAKLYQWLEVAKGVLSVETQTSDQHTAEWRTLWTAGIYRFFENDSVQNQFREAYAVIRDIRLLSRILTSLAAKLSPSSPFPSSQLLVSAISSQRTRPQLTSLHQLSYPSVCLLIASVHATRGGHASFTFEMLHESFQDQVRASSAAPVQVLGGNIGMAFEELISTHVFVSVAAPSSNTAKEFVKYRCIAEIEDVRKVVDRDGQLNLRKWFNKAQ